MLDGCFCLLSTLMPSILAKLSAVLCLRNCSLIVAQIVYYWCHHVCGDMWNLVCITFVQCMTTLWNWFFKSATSWWLNSLLINITHFDTVRSPWPDCTDHFEGITFLSLSVSKPETPGYFILPCIIHRMLLTSKILLFTSLACYF